MRILLLSVGAILGVALQATWLAGVNLPGRIIPDLILIMVISYGLLRGPDEGLFFGLAAGLFLDLVAGGAIGVQTLSKTIAGFSAGLLEKTIFKDNLLVPVIAVFVGTLLFESLNVLMYLSFGGNYNYWLLLISAIIPLAFYNAVLAPLVYRLFLKMESFIAERSDNL
ncbi:MAG: rod shape-determining protein MreD [Firmicutes bacterium]|nr:rod shape-determining protein MreD [Bacillota bacterium]